MHRPFNRAAELAECVKSGAMQPCSPSDPLLLGGGVRSCEQRGVESELDADFARHSVPARRGRLTRSPAGDGGLLFGIRCPCAVAQTDLNHKARRTIYPEPREEGRNCGGR